MQAKFVRNFVHFTTLCAEFSRVDDPDSLPAITKVQTTLTFVCTLN